MKKVLNILVSSSLLIVLLMATMGPRFNTSSQSSDSENIVVVKNYVFDGSVIAECDMSPNLSTPVSCIDSGTAPSGVLCGGGMGSSCTIGFGVSWSDICYYASASVWKNGTQVDQVYALRFSNGSHSSTFTADEGDTIEIKVYASANADWASCSGGLIAGASF